MVADLLLVVDDGRLVVVADDGLVYALVPEVRGGDLEGLEGLVRAVGERWNGREHRHRQHRGQHSELL